MHEIFGDVIHSYSRAEAIEDGVLIDMTQFSFRPGLTVCQECGIKYHVAMTAAAYAKTVQEGERPLPPGQDLSGRIFDVLSMFRAATKRTCGPVLHYRVSVTNWRSDREQEFYQTKQETVKLYAVCGPGDDAEPVITIMLPDED